MSSNRPNFLFVMTDQLVALALPFYGNPVANTPRLSAMADRGVLFEQAYCNSPLCAPSRASLMTGRLPSRLGVYDNAAEFSAEIPTFAHYLRAAGYQTCLSGKMHFVGPDQLHGFEERLTTDIYPVDFGWTPDWNRPEARFSWYHNMLSVVQAGLCQTSNQLDFDEEVAFQSVRKIYDLARSDDDRPFCLVASFTHPHDPFAITRAYWDRYRPSDIDMPAVSPIPHDQLDPHSRRLYHVCAMDQYRQTEERVRNARHAYYAMISYIDDKVGQLLQALESTGLSENTIVIFSSDHGEMLGERGLWYKMNFFEWSARVPLLFHAPGHFAPRRVAHPVSLVDILPTLVELAGQGQAPEYAAPLDGRSLTPFLRGSETDGDTNRVVGEYLAEGAIAPVVMIRRNRYKYVYSESDPDQLYDLATDPHELNNLAGRPDYEEIRTAFQAELLARWDLAALNRAVLASQRRRRLVADALMAGHYTAWDFQPHQDASHRYMRNHLLLDDLERRARFPTPETPAPARDK
jgi:choline-sulfatase